MVKALTLGFTIAFAANGTAALASTDDQRAQTFTERVADHGHPSNIKTTVGRLPDGWSSSVPLPAEVPILGVVQHLKSGSAEIFYQPTDAASLYASYVSELKQAALRRNRPGQSFGRYRRLQGSAPTVDLVSLLPRLARRRGEPSATAY